MKVLAVGAGHELAAGLLARRGHHVSYASEEQALKEAASAMPDLVLIPSRAGPGWCRSLRALPGGEWCLVLLDADGMKPEGLSAFLAAGIDDFYIPERGEALLSLRLAVAEARASRRFDALGATRSEARLRALLEAVPDAIVCVDTDGRITRANRQLEALSGYSRDELLGQPIEALVPPQMREKHVAMRDSYFRDPGVRPLGLGRSLLLHRKDGTTLPVDICLGMHLEDGKPVATAAVRDVRERRRMEEEVRQARDRAERAAELLRRDITSAARVQRALLPTSAPEAGPFRFAWRCLPCAGLGGDALSIHDLGHGLIGLYILDVSGHGASAALLSVALALQLRPQAWGGELGGYGWLTRPSEVAFRLNRWLLSQPTSDTFVTLIYGVLDIYSRTMWYVSAGHPDLLFLAPGEDPRLIRGEGMPLGVAQDAEFPEQHLELPEGALALLFSDGVTEAGAGRSQLGAEGLARVVASGPPGETPDQVCGRIVQAVTERAGEAHDDVSLLAIQG
jgi:PAS domain S-box-containing protein